MGEIFGIFILFYFKKKLKKLLVHVQHASTIELRLHHLNSACDAKLWLKLAFRHLSSAPLCLLPCEVACGSLQ